MCLLCQAASSANTAMRLADGIPVMSQKKNKHLFKNKPVM